MTATPAACADPPQFEDKLVQPCDAGEGVGFPSTGWEAAAENTSATVRPYIKAGIVKHYQSGPHGYSNGSPGNNHGDYYGVTSSHKVLAYLCQVGAAIKSKQKPNDGRIKSDDDDDGGILVGLTLVHNQPSTVGFASIGVETGNLTLLGPSLKYVEVSEGGLRAVDKKRNTYYFLGESKVLLTYYPYSYITLVGLATGSTVGMTEVCL